MIARPQPDPRPRPAGRNQGFTLVEVVVVMAMLALVLQFVLVNLDSMVPKTRLESESKILVGNLDFLRSEARIQGKRYALQLDLGNARWRMVLPAEERLTSEQTLEETLPQALDWNPLQEGVKFLGAGNPRNGIARNGMFEIPFDENGFTADQAIFLTLTDDPKMVWTVQIRGLTGQTTVLTSEDGEEHRLQEVTEGTF